MYLPDAPIKNIRDNPDGYKSPDQRGIRYENINLLVPDAPNDKIHGWYMYHKNSYHNTELNADGT